MRDGLGRIVIGTSRKGLLRASRKGLSRKEKPKRKGIKKERDGDFRQHLALGVELACYSIRLDPGKSMFQSDRRSCTSLGVIVISICPYPSVTARYKEPF